MGLYESELNKQIHLRNRQKKEWEMIKKKLALAQEKEKEKSAQGKNQYDQEQREADRLELEETQVSKNLAAAMVQSSLTQQSDTLQKVVDVLQNQNGACVNVTTTILHIIHSNEFGSVLIIHTYLACFILLKKIAFKGTFIEIGRTRIML